MLNINGVLLEIACEQFGFDLCKLLYAPKTHVFCISFMEERAQFLAKILLAKHENALNSVFILRANIQK